MSAPSSSQRSKRGTAVLVSLIVGIALAIFQSIVWLISEPLTSGITSSPSLVAFLLLVAPLIWAVAFFILCIWIVHLTGQIQDGTLTGLFSGVFGGIVAAVGHVLVITLSLHDSNQSPITIAYSTLGVATFTMILTIGAGSAFGAFGGLIGQYFSPVPPPPPARPVVPPPFYPSTPPYYGAPQQPASPASASQTPTPKEEPLAGGEQEFSAMRVAFSNGSEIVF
jgi:flagellar biosynthesis protein FliQ